MTGRMSNPPPPSGRIEQDALDDDLVSDHAPDDSKGHPDLDGLLASIVISPEPILLNGSP